MSKAENETLTPAQKAYLARAGEMQQFRIYGPGWPSVGRECHRAGWIWEFAIAGDKELSYALTPTGMAIAKEEKERNGK